MKLKKSGNNFWGDHLTLLLLQKALSINIILLSSEKLDFFW